MRASPPVAIELGRSTAWQAAVVTLSGATVCVLLAWAFLSEQPALWLRAAVVTGGGVLAAAAWRRAFPFEAELRWTGVRWQLKGGRIPNGTLRDGDVRVMIDLGSWMLLRFTPSDPASRKASWLPVQRGGLESRWHRLRCAVYAARVEADAS